MYFFLLVQCRIVKGVAVFHFNAWLCSVGSHSLQQVLLKWLISGLIAMDLGLTYTYSANYSAVLYPQAPSLLQALLQHNGLKHCSARHPPSTDQAILSKASHCSWHRLEIMAGFIAVLLLHEGQAPGSFMRSPALSHSFIRSSWPSSHLWTTLHLLDQETACHASEH